MRSDEQLERLLADWLEADAQPIPHNVLEGALESISRIAQVGGQRRGQQLHAVVVEEIAAAAPLHPYQAFAVGYSRAHEPIGRFAFAYAAAADATGDLAGRESLARTGTLAQDRSGRSYAEMFKVEAAGVAGPLLSIDVTPRDDLPQLLFQLVVRRDLSFAACAT